VSPNHRPHSSYLLFATPPLAPLLQRDQCTALSVVQLNRIASAPVTSHRLWFSSSHIASLVQLQLHRIFGSAPVTSHRLWLSCSCSHFGISTFRVPPMCLGSAGRFRRRTLRQGIRFRASNRRPNWLYRAHFRSDQSIRSSHCCSTHSVTLPSPHRSTLLSNATHSPHHSAHTLYPASARRSWLVIRLNVQLHSYLFICTPRCLPRSTRRRWHLTQQQALCSSLLLCGYRFVPSFHPA
jgi:hypothetical protein